MSAKSRILTTAVGWAVTAVCFGLLLLHARYYMPFLSDDALISFRYAERLIHGLGLTWTDGHPVEGYSNLLWLLLVAALGTIGMDLVAASRVLGVLCMGAVLACVAIWYLAIRRQATSVLSVAVALLFFVGTAPVAVWSIGGLEQPLIAAAVAGVIPLYWLVVEKDSANSLAVFALSALLGVLCLTRPDGPLFSVAIVGAILLRRPRGDRRRSWALVMSVVSVPILLYGGQLVFRLAYYGQWVPNTALVKLTPSSHHLAGGLRYMYGGLLAIAPASLLAAAFLAVGTFRSASRVRFVPLVLVTLLWLGYLVAIGGDIFPAYRHFVPIVVVMTYALAEGAAIMWNSLQGSRSRIILLGSLVGVLAMTAALQFRNPENAKAVEERWEWEGRALGLTLKKAFAEQQPLLAVTAAGCLPYWSELPCLDMLGLNDYYLPRHKPEDIGGGQLGHELGDGDYILQRAPDIIVFHVGSEPVFRSGAQLAASREFHRRYARMRVETSEPPRYTALVWFRVNSSKTGLQRTAEGLKIPAQLMNAFEHTTAFLDRGRLVVGVKADQPVGVKIEDMPCDGKVMVVSRDAEEIESRIERTANDSLVVLTTQSDAVLPVEAIVIAGDRAP